MTKSGFHSQQNTQGVVSLDPGNSHHVRSVSGLHAELLPQSPIPRLGSSFMEFFFYSLLVRDKLFECDLYFLNNECVGFISYTKCPESFMVMGVKRHPLCFLWILGARIITKPSTLGIVFRLIKDGLTRSSQKKQISKERSGEILSFAIKQEALTSSDPSTGKRISNVLFDKSIQYFRNENFQSFTLAVEKSNRAAILFYQYYGAEIVKPAYTDENSCRLKFQIQNQVS